jgi:plasmid stability protein
MNLTIRLPADETAALKAKARARGLSAEDYARQVLQQDLAPEWLQTSWEKQHSLASTNCLRKRSTLRSTRREEPTVNPGSSRAHDPGSR